jgi:hypothetical protein
MACSRIRLLTGSFRVDRAGFDFRLPTFLTEATVWIYGSSVAQLM